MEQVLTNKSGPAPFRCRDVQKIVYKLILLPRDDRPPKGVPKFSYKSTGPMIKTISLLQKRLTAKICSFVPSPLDLLGKMSTGS